jgi:hypothetical protein
MVAEKADYTIIDQFRIYLSLIADLAQQPVAPFGIGGTFDAFGR